jgi:hypothetical protein
MKVSLRGIFVFTLSFFATACGGNIENYFSTTNVYVTPDATVVQNDNGAGGIADQGVPAGAGGSDAGFDTDADAASRTDADVMSQPDTASEAGDAATSPRLVFAFEGPPAQIVFMDDRAVKPFCFSLEAQGATIDAWLPPMHIDAVDGGLVVTNSLSGVVFLGASVWEGTENVIESGLVSPSWDGTQEFFPRLEIDGIHIPEGTTRHLCVETDIVDFSMTPEDFFGKSYQLVMDDWSNASFFYSSGTQAILTRNRIIAPSKVVGNPLTVSAGGGMPPVKYTGTVIVSPSTSQHDGGTVTSGQADVPMLAFSLTASGGGACVRGIDVTRHGVGSAYDLVCMKLYEGTTSLFNACRGQSEPVNEKRTFGWHDPGLLFCMEGGTTRTFTVRVDFSATSMSGGMHALWIDDPATDVDIVKGTAIGSPIMGNTFVVGQ